jgi:rubrerythrin
MRFKETAASQRGEQTLWQCSNCGAVICTTGRRGKPKANCPSCMKDNQWSQEEAPIACFDNVN